MQLNYIISSFSYSKCYFEYVYDVIQRGYREGIEIEKGQIAYALARIIEMEGKNTVLEMVLHQGLNRQIRKMLDALGHPVISLKRLSMGPIDLQGLKKGQFKYLKPKQVEQVKNYLKKLTKEKNSNQFY